jgi:hypothetical protein
VSSPSRLPAAFLLTAADIVVALLLGLTDQMHAQVSRSICGNATSFVSAVGRSLDGLASLSGASPVVP